ncbi:hypothetical protein CF326_g9089 [Tilletia indica]|nr:hypothetical protein CF326_g9089 [Tilletia indica]
MSIYSITLRSHPNSPYSFNTKTFTFKSGEYRLHILGGDDTGIRSPTTSNGVFPAPIPTTFCELTFYRSEFWFRDLTAKSDCFGSLVRGVPVRQVRDADSATALEDGDHIELGLFEKSVGDRSHLDFLCRVIFVVQIEKQTKLIPRPVPRASQPKCRLSPVLSHREDEPVQTGRPASLPSDPVSVSASNSAPSVSHPLIPPSSSTISSSSTSSSNSISVPAGEASAPHGTRWSGVQHLVNDVRAANASTAMTQQGSEANAYERRAPMPSSTTSPRSETLPAFSYSKLVTTSQSRLSSSTDTTTASGTAISPTPPSASATARGDRTQAVDGLRITTADLALRRIASAWTQARRWVDSVSPRDRSFQTTLRRIHGAWEEARWHAIHQSSSSSSMVSSDPAPSKMASARSQVDLSRGSRTIVPSCASSSADVGSVQATSTKRRIERSGVTYQAPVEPHCFPLTCLPPDPSPLRPSGHVIPGHLHIAGSIGLAQLVGAVAVISAIILSALVLLQHYTLRTFAAHHA